MIKSGFFNSMNGDRKYDASRFAEYFASFIGNGVFPDSLQVISNNNMTVTVKSGKAWINGYIMINDADYILNINAADGVLNRIDRIVLRFDVVDREIRLEVKQGTFAGTPVAPALQRDSDVYELCLADISVVAGAINISQGNILDTRLISNLCGKVDTLIAGDFLSLSEDVSNVQENKLDKTGDGKDIKVTFTEAAAEAHIASGETLSVMFGKILKKFKSIIPISLGGTGANTVAGARNALGLGNTSGALPIANGGTGALDAANARTNLGVPPVSHASTATTYGVGSTANYGHVKTINDLTQASHADGTALSAYQGKILNDKIKVDTPVLLADFNLSSSAKTDITNYLTGAYDRYVFAVTFTNYTVTTTATSGTRGFAIGLHDGLQDVTNPIGSYDGVILTYNISATTTPKSVTMNGKYNFTYQCHALDGNNTNGIKPYYYRMTKADQYFTAGDTLYCGLYLVNTYEMSITGTANVKIYGQNTWR